MTELQKAINQLEESMQILQSMGKTTYQVRDLIYDAIQTLKKL